MPSDNDVLMLNQNKRTHCRSFVLISVWYFVSQLTHSALTKSLSEALELADFNSSQYSGNNLLRSECTFALSCQPPTYMIKAQGDRSSNSYEIHYITLNLREKFASVMGEKTRSC